MCSAAGCKGGKLFYDCGISKTRSYTSTLLLSCESQANIRWEGVWFASSAIVAVLWIVSACAELL